MLKGFSSLFARRIISIMQHTIERKNGDLNITVTLDKAEITKVYDSTVRKLCEDISVKGFRKGHAPIEKARQLIEPRLLEDRFTRNLIDKAFRSYVVDPEVVNFLESNAAPGAVPSVSLASQSGDVITFIYAAKPVVKTLGQYKGIATGVVKEEVTDETVQKELERIAHEEADLVPTEEPIAEGFTVNCDIHGSINGIENASLTEKAFDIKVGTKRFIPGIEEKLIGHKAGENVTVEADLPHNYPEEVADKHAVFEIRINSVKKEDVPAIDDELATVQSEYEGCANLEDLKNKIRERQGERAQRIYENNKLGKILAAIVEKSEFEIDEARLKEALVADQRKKDEQTLSAQGLDLPTYLRLIQMTEQTYTDNVYRNLSSSLKSDAVMDAVFADAKLEPVTDEEYAAEASSHGVKLDELKTRYLEDYKKSFKGATDEQAEAYFRIRTAAIFRNALTAKVRKFLLDNND